MNKWTALQEFWSRFGIPAYDSQSVPDDAKLPYITYEAQVDSLERVLSMTSNIWYRDVSSWKAICDKADEIDRYLDGGVTLKMDSGYLWITKGTPFAQRLADNNDDTIKRMIINIQAEYLSR